MATIGHSRIGDDGSIHLVVPVAMMGKSGLNGTNRNVRQNLKTSFVTVMPKMEIENPLERRVVCRVLSHYGDTEKVLTVESLRSAGGFSGAELWRVSSDRGLFCLRRWPPEHPSESRLQSIHRVLRGVLDRGVVEVAAPVTNHALQTIVNEDGALWELTPWMPGVADYHQSPSSAKLAAAMQTLARFHLAAAACSPQTFGAPVGILSRRDQLRRLMTGGFSELRQTIQLTDSYVQQFLDCFPILAPSMLGLLERAGQHRLPLQPCIRDVWHDHVLFTSDRVTGLIDFGAMRVDHVAGDIARLLGSLVRDDATGWTAGIAAYEQLRSLTPLDRQLVTVYDQSGVLLSGMNWLQWLFVEGRTFDNLGRVHQRCAEIAARLTNLVAKWEGTV